jgi:predicted RND superfamily exporter protein
VPFDIISAPAVNIAIGMGIDAMLHLMNAVRRHGPGAMGDVRAWRAASARMVRPVVSSAAIVCTGFAIFGLSAFPPTQRFGGAIVLGTLVSPLAALCVFPLLAAGRRVPARHA